VRLHKVRRTYGAEINIAPLIDVVFLLIIFFMVVTRITRVEVEELELPEAQSGKAADVREPSRLVISVPKDGRISMGGRGYTLGSLSAELTAHGRRRANGEPSVLIRADRDAEWQTVARIMALCAAGRIQQVRVAVVEPGDDAQ
jgi:biopolymer transport protein ExbD